MVRLYNFALAPNPRRVRLFMAEKAITDVEQVEVDIMSGAHRVPEFLARAGLSEAVVASVPVLELDDGTVICESIAICRYLESLYPEPNMFGASAREIAEIEMWTRRCEMLYATPLMLSARLSHPAMAPLEPANPEAAKYFIAMAERFAPELNHRLAGREFIVGDRLTMADIVVVCALDFVRIIRVKPDSSQENLNAYVKRLRDRPSATA